MRGHSEVLSSICKDGIMFSLHELSQYLEMMFQQSGYDTANSLASLVISTVDLTLRELEVRNDLLPVVKGHHVLQGVRVHYQEAAVIQTYC